jgi:hypothetical protein
MNENWTDRLSEYLDGELDSTARKALESQLANDAALRATLDELRAVTSAATRQIETSPTADLWPDIHDRISAEPATHRRRTIMVTIPQFAAAAGVMLLLGVGLARMGLDARPEPASSGAIAELESSADASFVSNPVTSDPAGYRLFVEDLEGRLEAGQGVLADETLRVLEQSLAKIDQAITQAKAALEADPNNTYLNQHLASARARKLRLLENATALVASST